jgi:hypothetical protein
MVPNVSIIPSLLFGVFVGGIVFLALLLNPRNARLGIGCMFFLASISMILDWDKRVFPTLLLPLQAYRSQLFGVMGVLLLAGFLLSARTLPWRRVSPQAWVLLAMGVYAGLLRTIHVTPEDGLVSAAMAIATILPLALVLPLQFRDDADAEKYVKVLVWVAVIWTIGSLVQYVIDPKLAVLGQKRHFTGLSSNPNLAATVLNVVALCSLWLSLNSRARSRWIYIWLTGLFAVLLAWTGSRAGMLSLFVGVAAVVYAKLGRVALLLPFMGLALLAVFKLAVAAGVDLDTEKLLSMKNSRVGLAAKLFNDFLQSPIIGVGPDKVEFTENSYMLALGQYGAGMFLLVLTMCGVSALQWLRLWRLRGRVTRPYVALIDLCIAQQVMYFFNALFEGIMVGRVGPSMVVILIFSAIGQFLIEQAPAIGLEASPLDPDGVEGWDESASAGEPSGQPV